MLAKAVATECKTTFFNISASSIVSKWRGMLDHHLSSLLIEYYYRQPGMDIHLIIHKPNIVIQN